MGWSVWLDTARSPFIVTDTGQCVYLNSKILHYGGSILNNFSLSASIDLESPPVPTNTISYVGPMLSQRRRRWTSICPA